MQALKDKYLQRQSTFLETAKQLNDRYSRLSYVRLAFFILATAAIILIWSFNILLGIGTLVVFFGLFYRFVQWHLAIKNEAQHNERLAKINGQEAAVIDHKFDGFASGQEFLDQQHAFALDLDIFGDFSLFQYCNRTTSLIGRKKLANIFLKSVSLEVINQRHEAIKELTDKLDWRQDFQAYGLETEDDPSHLKALELWLEDEPFVSKTWWLRAALYLTPIWVTAGILMWIYVFSWPLFVVWMLPVAYTLKTTLDRVNDTHRRTTHAEEMLSHYSRLIKHLEGDRFESLLLQELHEAFVSGESLASKRIKRLSYVIGQLNVRYNAFAVLLNLTAIWDLQWVYQLEKWKKKEKDHLLKWFESMATFEALCSLANLHYNNPSWTYPEVAGFEELQAEELGHPLIHESVRVCNDITIPLNGHIKLVTGSNMAGKSTFLRTVGLNIVMGLAGAPVCAKTMKLPLMEVYTSMRTQDALHESTSSFYAELKRLKFIIEAVEEQAALPIDAPERKHVFFLLDEILKGTNSVDRHTGSKALIRQLIESKGSGIIATHDLELGGLEKTYDGRIENLCIEVEIKDGELYFDYKLKQGVSESFNATLLMQNMGIRVH
jgi:hypothetical protein